MIFRKSLKMLAKSTEKCKMFINTLYSPKIFQGGTKLVLKSTSRQNYIEKRSPNDFDL